MNGLLAALSADMNIARFTGEEDDAWAYRLCYSAIGQWCLSTGQNSSCGVAGTTRRSQANVLNELQARFSELFPGISDKFEDDSKRSACFSAHIRTVYEETGYLLKVGDKRNKAANYGRCIPIGDRALFFGVPGVRYAVNGLGAFIASPTEYTEYKVDAKEFLIRDDMTCEEFFESRFDPVDFYDKDIDMDSLEFFNPKSDGVPSRSWEKRPATERTIARRKDGEGHAFYRVMDVSGAFQFADEPAGQRSESLTSREYRRLYYALKAHYKTPLRGRINKFDDGYSGIRIGGYLPNREYYYLLLLSWPMGNAFNRVNFLIQNDLLAEATEVLKNIGIEIETEENHANMTGGISRSLRGCGC